MSIFNTKKQNPSQILSIFKGKIAFVALEGNSIVGVIRGTKEKISSLMVDEGYHNIGIGHKLVERFEKESKRQGGKVIKIKSSFFAVKFYQSVGYKKTTGVRNFMGLKVINMKKSFV